MNSKSEESWTAAVGWRVRKEKDLVGEGDTISERGAESPRREANGADGLAQLTATRLSKLLSPASSEMMAWMKSKQNHMKSELGTFFFLR